MSKSKTTIRAVASILGVTILGAGLLACLTIFSSLMPNGGPRESLSESAVLGKINDSDYSVVKLGPVNLNTRDDFSECVELGHVLSPESSNFDSRPSARNLSPCEDLNQILSAEGSGVSEDQIFYGRFWHGTAAVTKLLLFVTDLSSIRGLLTFMIIALTLALTFVAFRRDVFVGSTLAVFFFLASDIPFQGLLLTHGIPTFMGLLFSLAAYLVPKTSTYLYYSVASLAGVFYAFFAQLFTPLLFMMLLVVFRILRTNEGDSANRFSTAVSGSIWWLVGYAAMMIARFLELSIRLGIDTTIFELSSSTANKFTSNPIDLFVALFAHLFIQTEGNHLRAVGFSLLSICLGFVIGLTFKTSKVNLKIATKISLPLAWVIAWYLLMLGHNGHGFVANLTLGTLTYCILALRWLTTSGYSPSK